MPLVQNSCASVPGNTGGSNARVAEMHNKIRAPLDRRGCANFRLSLSAVVSDEEEEYNARDQNDDDEDDGDDDFIDDEEDAMPSSRKKPAPAPRGRAKQVGSAAR